MRNTAILLLLLAAAPAGGLQLPPQVLADQLLLRAERLLEADDLDAAVQVMEEASALAAEHELELPPDFHFRRARTEFAVGLLGAAKESVTEYLTVAGREAESYAEAVALLEDVDRILERRDAPECSPLPEGPACWMELTSHPGCYVWNPSPQATATAVWTGECSVGFAQGPGTVTWIYGDGEQEHQASRRFGQPHGESVIRDSQGWVNEGPFRFGKSHGDWIERTADGAVLEGPYVDGERNGHWVLRFANGFVEEGPLVEGKRNGHWVFRGADGGVYEGPFANDEKNGHWVERFADGEVWEGPYVDGERNGDWVVKFADETGFLQGPYMDGERNGHWVERFASGNAEGEYVADERHGHWVLRYLDGKVESGPYVDGAKHGRWRVAFPDGEVDYVEFVHGVRQEP